MMGKQKISEIETKRRIYNYISEYPGLHLRELSRRLKIPKTTLEYHLNHLEKHELIVVKFEDRCARFYITKNCGNLEKKVIHVLRQKTPRNIVLYIGWVTNASQAELSRELELAPATVAHHLKRLVSMGVVEPVPAENGIMYTAHKNKRIIERNPVGREIIYRLAKTSNQNVVMDTLVGDLFIRYKKGLVNDAITKLILDGFRLWFPGRRGRSKRVRGNKVIMKDMEKQFWDMFPHPYHV